MFDPLDGNDRLPLRHGPAPRVASRLEDTNCDFKFAQEKRPVRSQIVTAPAASSLSAGGLEITNCDLHPDRLETSRKPVLLHPNLWLDPLPEAVQHPPH